MATRTVLMIALILAAIGAINWGLVGLFEFDLVAAITGAGDFGETNAISRIIYVIVGIAGIVSLGALPLLSRMSERESMLESEAERRRSGSVRATDREQDRAA